VRLSYRLRVVRCCQMNLAELVGESTEKWGAEP
jgi:hypothetical protein